MNVPTSELMPVVGAALERGQRVRMTVTGGSMLPFLCGGEEIEIERASSIRIGDIVIARVGDAYVLHRVVGMDRAGRIFLRGDAQMMPVSLERGIVRDKVADVFFNIHVGAGRLSHRELRVGYACAGALIAVALILPLLSGIAKLN